MFPHRIHGVLRSGVHFAIQLQEHHRTHRCRRHPARWREPLQRNKRPASRLPFTMNATPILIQCRYRQSAINAKCLPRQPAGFIFRNQPLHLNPLRRLRTTPGSLIAQVHHETQRHERVRCSDGYRFAMSSAPSSKRYGSATILLAMNSAPPRLCVPARWRPSSDLKRSIER